MSSRAYKPTGQANKSTAKSMLVCGHENDKSTVKSLLVCGLENDKSTADFCWFLGLKTTNQQQISVGLWGLKTTNQQQINSKFRAHKSTANFLGFAVDLWPAQINSKSRDLLLICGPGIYC